MHGAHQQAAAAAAAEAARQRLFTAGKRAYEFGQVQAWPVRLPCAGAARVYAALPLAPLREPMLPACCSIRRQWSC